MAVSACTFIRKLLSKWNPLTCPVSPAQTALCMLGKTAGLLTPVFPGKRRLPHWAHGALLARMTAEITDSGDSAGV